MENFNFIKVSSEFKVSKRTVGIQERNQLLGNNNKTYIERIIANRENVFGNDSFTIIPSKETVWEDNDQVKSPNGKWTLKQDKGILKVIGPTGTTWSKGATTTVFKWYNGHALLWETVRNVIPNGFTLYGPVSGDLKTKMILVLNNEGELSVRNKDEPEKVIKIIAASPPPPSPSPSTPSPSTPAPSAPSPSAPAPSAPAPSAPPSANQSSGSITSESNLALRINFENNDFYKNNQIAGDMDVRGLETGLEQTQYHYIEGNYSGSKSDANHLDITNFIDGYWTITFWYRNDSELPTSYQTIIGQGKYFSSTSWRLYIFPNGTIGMYANGERGTTINASDIKGKWTLFGITSDNKIYIKTHDGIYSYYNALNYNANGTTSDDSIEFGADAITHAAIPSYFDDIRVYNKVLSQSELNSVFGEAH
jgi:hypothetical protein